MLLSILFALLKLHLAAGQTSVTEINEYDVEVDTISPSSSHTVHLVLSTQRLHDANEILEERLGVMLDQATKAARSLKYGLNSKDEWIDRSPSPSPSLQSSSLSAKIVKMDSIPTRTIIHFVSYIDGKAISAEAIVRDISLLSTQEISAILHYPVSQVSTTERDTIVETASWWKIGLIIGGGALILFIGWCCLFLYFNTCGRLSWDKKQEMYEDRDTRVISTDEVNNYSRRDDTMEREEERSDEHRQRATAPLEPIEVNEQPTKAVMEMKNTEKREEDEQLEGKVQPAKSDVVRTMTNERPTRVEIATEPRTNEERRDSTDSLEINDEQGEEFDDDTMVIEKIESSRPRAAGLRRPIRTIDGRVITEKNPSSQWTTFTAGDRVNAIFSIRPPSSYEQPTPLPPTLNGIVQLTSINPTQQQQFARFL